MRPCGRMRLQLVELINPLKLDVGEVLDVPRHAI